MYYFWHDWPTILLARVHLPLSGCQLMKICINFVEPPGQGPLLLLLIVAASVKWDEV